MTLRSKNHRLQFQRLLSPISTSKGSTQVFLDLATAEGGCVVSCDHGWKKVTGFECLLPCGAQWFYHPTFPCHSYTRCPCSTQAVFFTGRSALHLCGFAPQACSWGVKIQGNEHCRDAGGSAGAASVLPAGGNILDSLRQRDSAFPLSNREEKWKNYVLQLGIQVPVFLLSQDLLPMGSEWWEVRKKMLGAGFNTEHVKSSPFSPLQSQSQNH